MRPGTGKSGRIGVLPDGSSTAQLLLALALFAPVSTLSAGTVSSCDEASLRAAMSGGGVVTFACSGTITLSSTLVIATHTVLDASAHSIIISGNGNVRVFYVNPGVSLVLSNLTIAGGRAPGTDSFDPRYGPGLFNDGGNVVIAGCTFSGNKALSVNWHGSGGAIYNASGTLNVSASTFVENVASGEGAWRGMGRGGAIFIEMGTANLVNCTFFRNTARTYSADWRMTGSYGGAVFNDQGRLWITNCTFAENRADGQSYSFGGHLWSTGSVTLVNCILANSLMGGNGATNFIDAGHNISSDNSCGFLAPGSLNNVDVKLGPLASNGGPTMTIMPLNGSPAIDAGDEAACPSQDQRGIARLIGGACDIGAVETPGGVFRFSSSLYTGWEAVGVVSITVERLDYFQRQISVDFRTGSGDLAPGLDYVATNGTLVFQANELCKSFDVQVLADSVPEVSESVSLVLSDPFGGGLGTPSLATLTILDGGLPTNLCSEVGLAAALSVGGPIQFDCDATIMLADTLVCAKDAVLDARNHRVTLSGNNSVRVLEVCSGVNLSLLNVTIADGRSSDGGGVYNSGGRLTMVNCTFTNNHAVGLPGANGTNGLRVAPGICLEVGEDGTPGERGQVARGGAVFNAGTVIATNTVFVGNTAEGGAGGSGGAGGQGGRCIDQFGRCVFEVRGGTGGDGAPAGGASGGAIFNLGSTVLENVTIRDNRTLGGRSGAGGAAGPAGCGAYIGAHPGFSAVGGASQGGGIYNEGSLLLSAVSLFGNAAHGGAGGKGADESPGRYATPGAMGGRGVGGAIANFGTNTMVNVTLALNRTIGGDGGLGGFKYGCPIERNGNGGDGIGGGVFNSGRFSATNCTIWANDSAGGLATNLPAGCTVRRDGLHGTGFAASIQNTGGVATLVNSILGNPASSSNCVGVIIDLGHNICSDASAAFTALGSLNNTDPGLGPLADNGGPTRTMGLEPGSPALDAADNGQCPPTDQRGVSRPVGVACDIGAFEGTDGWHFPQVTQSFQASSVRYGETVRLFFSLHNPNPFPLTHVSFTNFLGGFRIASFPDSSNSCSSAIIHAEPLGHGLSASEIELGAGESCAVSVSVISFLVGHPSNVVMAVSSAETGYGAKSIVSTLWITHQPTSLAELHLNGTNQFIHTQTAFDSPQVFTLSLWFRTETSRGGMLLGFADQQLTPGNYRDRFLYLNNAGQLSFAVWNSGTFTITSMSPFNDGHWHHAAATLASDGMKLFADGQLVAVNAAVNLAVGYNGWWKIGYGSFSGWPGAPSSAYFQGEIDEVQIWDRSLSSEEISRNMTQARTGAEPGLVSYWRLDENGGAEALDATGRGNTGILVNAPTWFAATSPVVEIAPISRLPDGRVKLQFLGQSGSLYKLQTSINLVDWADLVVQPAGARGLWEFTHAESASFQRRFYRLIAP